MDWNKTSKIIIKVCVKMSIYLIMIIFLYIVGTKGFEFGEKVFAVQGIEEAPGRDISVIIPAGSSKMEVGRLLKNYGLIDDPYVFMVQSYIYELDIYPGTHNLNTSYSPEDIMIALSKEPVTEETTSDSQ